MAKISKFRPEIFFYAFLFILGFIIMNVAWKYGFGSLGTPGPGLYPFFVGLSISSSVFLHLLSTLRGKKDRRSKPIFDRYGIKQFLLMNITFSLWVLVMPYVGYVLVTFLTNFVFCRIMKLEGWLKPVALSAGTTLFIYLLFDYFLYTDLPRGILG